MSHQRPILLVVLILCCSGTRPQTARSITPTALPLLRLKFVPNKETYAMNERVFIKAVITNLSDQTLCFPKPDREATNPIQGYLYTEVTPPAHATEIEQFINHIDARPIPRDKLLAEIEQRWIKVLPNARYTTESTQFATKFSVPGQWQLESTYFPPESGFGRGYREHLKTAASSVGCTLPDADVSAEPITIFIVASGATP
jgi:hypothetical protein